MTVGIAIIFAFILPNSIRRLRGFSQQEREWILWNYESDLGQQDNSSEVSGRKGLMMALADWKMWSFMALLTSVYISAAVTNFFPSVVGGLGYSRNKTYGLTAPPFVLCVICMLINGFHSDRKQERFLHIVGPLCITLVANIIAVSTLNVAARCKLTSVYSLSIPSVQIPNHSSRRRNDAHACLILFLLDRHPILDNRKFEPTRA